MLSLGGAALASSASAALLDKAAEAAIVKAKTNAKRNKRKIDPATAVLLSDIHICGELENGKSKHYPYNPTCLKLRIAEILSMRPLPANVLVFGDVAWDYGLEEDYRYAAELLSELDKSASASHSEWETTTAVRPFSTSFPNTLLPPRLQTVSYQLWKCPISTL